MYTVYFVLFSASVNDCNMTKRSEILQLACFVEASGRDILAQIPVNVFTFLASS